MPGPNRHYAQSGAKIEDGGAKAQEAGAWDSFLFALDIVSKIASIVTAICLATLTLMAITLGIVLLVHYSTIISGFHSVQNIEKITEVLRDALVEQREFDLDSASRMAGPRSLVDNIRYTAGLFPMIVDLGIEGLINLKVVFARTERAAYVEAGMEDDSLDIDNEPGSDSNQEENDPSPPSQDPIFHANLGHTMRTKENLPGRHRRPSLEEQVAAKRRALFERYLAPPPPQSPAAVTAQ